MADRKVFIYTKPFVGQILPDYIGTPDRIAFDIDDTGAYLRVSYRGISPQELRDFNGKNKTVGVLKVENFLWLVCKLGTQQWMDAPYTPHLSQRLHLLDDHVAMRRLCGSITIALIDTLDGKIKSLTENRLPRDLADYLCDLILTQYAKPFDQDAHNHMVDLAMQQFSTQELAMHATKARVETLP